MCKENIAKLQKQPPTSSCKSLSKFTTKRLRGSPFLTKVTSFIKVVAKVCNCAKKDFIAGVFRGILGNFTEISGRLLLKTNAFIYIFPRKTNYFRFRIEY